MFPDLLPEGKGQTPLIQLAKSGCISLTIEYRKLTSLKEVVDKSRAGEEKGVPRKYFQAKKVSIGV